MKRDKYRFIIPEILKISNGEETLQCTYIRCKKCTVYNYADRKGWVRNDYISAFNMPKDMVVNDTPPKCIDIYMIFQKEEEMKEKIKLLTK